VHSAVNAPDGPAAALKRGVLHGKVNRVTKPQCIKRSRRSRGRISPGRISPPSPPGLHPLADNGGPHRYTATVTSWPMWEEGKLRLVRRAGEWNESYANGSGTFPAVLIFFAFTG